MQNGNLVHRIKELHEKYGEIVRIAPNELSYISASAWHDIYGHHPGRGTISKWGYGAVPTGAHSIFTADDSEHFRYRRLLARAFSDKALRDMEPILQKHTDGLVSSFRKQISHSNTGSAVVNLVNWYSFTGYDITRELSFGEVIQLHPIRAFSSLELDTLRASGSALLVRFFPIPQLPRHGARSSTRAAQKCDPATPDPLWSNPGISLQTFRDARRSRGVATSPRKIFVAHMLRNGGDANSKGMSVPELEASINDLLLAGTETSSTALTGITNLLQNPRELTALVDEIRTAIPHESDITSSAVHELRHLSAVIEEGLRLAPPVPEGLARIVAPEGQFIAGHWIPGGTHVSAPQYATNRSLRLPSLPLAPAQPPRLLIARFQQLLARPAQLHREERRVQRDAARACEVAVGV